MGIHDLESAALLIGCRLNDVVYARTDQIEQIDRWEGGDLTEMILLSTDRHAHTLWISEGTVDRIALAGPLEEVTPGPVARLAAANREPWRHVVGSIIQVVRSASTARTTTRPRRSQTALPQALELTFDNGACVTLAGYQSEEKLDTTWFDDIAVLSGRIDETLPAPTERDLSIHAC